MPSTFLSSGDLLNSLSEVVEDDIQRGDGFIVGAIKKGDNKNVVLVSMTGISEWVELPIKMIESAKIVGMAVSEAERYQVALIKLRESEDSFAKAAYQLLAHLGTIGHPKSLSNGCNCQREGENNGGSAAGSHSGVSTQQRRIGGGVFGGVGGLGIGIRCRFIFRCYECTRCIPWTDWCWSSTCCDLVGVDCGIG